MKRGGGIEIWVEKGKSTDKEKFYIFYVSVDTKEAMGANMQHHPKLVSQLKHWLMAKVLWLFSQILRQLSCDSLNVSSHHTWILDTRTTKGEKM